MDDGRVCGNHVLAAWKQAALKTFRFFFLRATEKF
jgi:hypothetical protein